MKQNYHQSLSARSIQLPSLGTLMGNPQKRQAGPLDQVRWGLDHTACRGGTLLAGGRKKSHSKLEPGQFVLWLSRQWNVLNPCEDLLCCGPEKNTKSEVEEENMPSQQVSAHMAPPSCERRVWHLTFLTMKDGKTVAGANFIRWRKIPLALICSSTFCWMSLCSHIWIDISAVLEWAEV